MKRLNWGYSHASHLVYSSTAFEMSEKCKSTSLHAIQMQYNWWQTTSTEEKLDTKSQLEKGDQIFYICHNARLADGSICTVCDNADRITESAKLGTEVCVCLCSQSDYHSPTRMNHTKNYASLLHFIALYINKYTEYKCLYTVYTVHIYSTGPYIH